MATATLMVRHRVNDYGTWRSVYESVENLRQQHGCTAEEVLVDPGDKHEVFVLHRFPTLEQAEAFAGSDDAARRDGPRRHCRASPHRDCSRGLS